MKLTKRRSGITWTMSPASSAPRRRRQCSTVAAREVAAEPEQRQAAGRAPCVSPSQSSIAGSGPHDPLAVGLVQQDRDAAEGAAPLDHRRVVVRVRDRDRARAAARLTASTAASSISGTQSQRTLPAGVSDQQRALADRERGLDADAE